MKLIRTDSTYTFEVSTGLEFIDDNAPEGVRVRGVRRVSVVMEDGRFVCANMAGETPEGRYGVAIVTDLNALPQAQFAFINSLIAATHASGN